MKSLTKFMLLVAVFLVVFSCEDLAKVNDIAPDVKPIPDTTAAVIDTNKLIISKKMNIGVPRINIASDTAHTSYPINDGFFKPLPSAYEDKINSFYLPKGYMIVFAENSDATGESACFVAMTSPIKAILPTRLQNKVSYIRYHAINNPTKKGSGNTNEITVIASQAAWYYSWGFTRASFANQQFVPMTWGKTSCSNTNAIYLAKRTDVDHLLSFNEPDAKDQSNVLVDTAIVRYKIMQKTGLRLGSPVTTQDQSFGTGKWLSQFMEIATKENLRIDYIALHWYDWGNQTNNKATDALTADAIFKRFVVYIERVQAAYPGKPIWITEFNANINRTSVSVHKIFMKLATDWLNNQDNIERYAYFFPSPLPEKDANDNLTEIGAYWKEITSPKSFKANITADAIIIE
jgi:hypothetical protein